MATGATSSVRRTGGPAWCDEGREVPLDLSHPDPPTIIEAAFRPARQFQASIIGLTIVEVARQNGSSCGTPGFISDDALARAVGVVDLELGEQRESVAIDIATSTIEAEAAAIPPVAKDGPYGIVPFAQEIRDVEGLVVQAVGDNWSIREPEHDRQR